MKPIIFSGPMVRAILEGNKTQTRRALRSQPPDWATGHDDVWPWVHFTGADPFHGNPVMWTAKCPYGEPGNHLWVRETFAYYYAGPNFTGNTGKVYYKADGDLSDRVKERDCVEPRWRPSIFMPRWASRITLEIISVRVERVQDISHEDALAEGIDPDAPLNNYGTGSAHRDTFAELWDSINAKRGYSWDSDSWVWVIEFKQTN